MLDLALRTEGPRRRTTDVIVLRTILVAMALLATIATAVAAPSPPLPLKCVAFSPYVAGYNPATGPHPPRALIDGVSASRLLAADLDGNGRSDLVVDFGTPYGTWIWLNDQAWLPLNAFSPTCRATTDLDATGRDALVADFGSPYGIWTYRYGIGWAPLLGLSAARLATGDFDGDGRGDVVADFGTVYGLWWWAGGTDWKPLHQLSSRGLYADEIER